jgi:N-acetylglucosamine-6-phosphate deacetylase
VADGPGRARRDAAPIGPVPAEAGVPPFAGFVDLQVNGMQGLDFSADGLSPDDCARAFAAIRAGGTAAFLPTVITAPLDRLRRNLATIAAAARAFPHRGAVAGIHLEGPFLDPTPGAIGAHNPDWVLPPEPALFDRLQEAADGTIRVLTVSAGLAGVEALIEHAAASGVLVSLGHSMGGYAEVRRAADAGATMLTHLGNGLPHEVGRHENPLLAGLAEERLAAGIIADGHHLPDELVCLIVRVKGTEGTILVSDAAPVAGLPPGRYTTLGNEVEVTADGLVVNPRTRYLAGSGRTLMQCVNRLAGSRLFAPGDLVRMSVVNPARIIGVDPADLDGPGVRFDQTRDTFVTG